MQQLPKIFVLMIFPNMARNGRIQRSCRKVTSMRRWDVKDISRLLLLNTITQNKSRK